MFLSRNCLFAALFVGTCKHTLIDQYYIWIYLFTVHYSDCLHAKITCCWWVWLLPVRASGQRGGNVGLGYEKLIFAILRFCDHCLWSRHASVPSVQDHLRGNEVWNSAGDSTGRILFLSMTYDCCAMYIYYDTIWLGLLREAYTRMLLIMWGKISRVIYNRSFILFIGVLDVDMYSHPQFYDQAHIAWCRISLGFVSYGIRY